MRCVKFHLAVAALLLLLPLPAVAQSFEAELDPVPFDDSTKPNVVGIGTVTAALDGNTLSISGTFSGLSSAATAAHLEMGLDMGVIPGTTIGELTIAHDQSGAVSGKAKLSAAQLAALKHNSIYIRIDSEKAPNGNLQGWLEPSDFSAP